MKYENIRNRLWALLALAVIWAVALGAVGYTVVSGQLKETDQRIDVYENMAFLVFEIREDLLKNRRREKAFFLNTRNPASQKHILEQLHITDQNLVSNLNKLLRMAEEAPDIRQDILSMVHNLEPGYRIEREAFTKVVQAVKKDPDIIPWKANQMMSRYRKPAMVFEASLEKVAADFLALSEQAEEETQVRIKKTIGIILAAALAGLFVLLMIGFQVWRSMDRRIERLNVDLESSGFEELTPPVLAWQASQRLAEEDSPAGDIDEENFT